MPDIILPPPPTPKVEPVEIPLDLQGAALVIKRTGGDDDDDPVLQAMVRAGEVIREAAEATKVSHESIMGNQLKSPIQNLANSKRRVGEIAATALKKLTEIRDRVDRKLSELERATLPTPPKDAVGAVVAIYASNVMQALRSMKPEERMKAMHEAIVAGDAVSVAAAINGLPWLTGLSAEEQAIIRDKWQTHWHGDTLGRARKLREGQGHVDRLTRLYTKWTSSLYAEKDGAIAAAEHSARLAEAAMASG